MSNNEFKDFIDRESRLGQSPEILKSEISAAAKKKRNSLDVRALKKSFFDQYPQFKTNINGPIWGSAWGVRAPEGPGLVIFSTRPIRGVPTTFQGYPVTVEVGDIPRAEAQ